MSPERGDVLLTGATGFVGMEVLERYVERSDRRIVTLVRAADDEAARARIDGGAREPVRRAGRQPTSRARAGVRG